jgi:hypothetical protein
VIAAISPRRRNVVELHCRLVIANGKNAIPNTENPFEVKLGESGAFEAATQEGETLSDFSSKVEVMG